MRPLVDNEISKKTGFGNFDPALVTETWKWVAASQDYPESKLNPESVRPKSDRSWLHLIQRGCCIGLT
jgi:NitT/TauT family transport system substrate-binding protein